MTFQLLNENVFNKIYHRILNFVKMQNANKTYTIVSALLDVKCKYKNAFKIITDLSKLWQYKLYTSNNLF